MNQAVTTINTIIGVLFTLCYAYQIIYYLVGIFGREEPHGEGTSHRFAVLIAARNEEAVIGHLLESIRSQNYPAELIRTFVVADNCTDGTADAARASGAEVLERFDRERVGKGYALASLLEHIRQSYGEDAFDGYFVFDADNLLEPDYIARMNRNFSEGDEIVTGYRNSKNYGENWVSAGNALWFLREAQFLNRPRRILGTSCTVSGTGFLFSKGILRRWGGWKFFLMTEDIEFSVANILEGTRIGYYSDAVLYDEQPVSFRQSWRQRLRWARGTWQVFTHYGARLAKRCVQKRDFACFDASMIVSPLFIFTAFSTLLNLAMVAASAALGRDVLPAVISFVRLFAGSYAAMLAMGAVALISEWKKIRCPGWRKLALLLTFPVFQMTYIPISCIAMFKRVEWKPIHHRVAVSLKEMDQGMAI